MAANPTRLITVAALQVVLVFGAATCAWGQMRKRAKESGAAVSYAYAGSEQGTRLEMARERFVYSGGYFNADDADIWALEVGVHVTEGIRDYGGIRFVLGGGWYRTDFDVGGTDDEFALWAGTGSFDHARRGLFFQYRYIFGGTLKGPQGVVGWAF